MEFIRKAASFFNPLKSDTPADFNAEKEWESTFNAINAAIWIIDENYHILKSNLAARKIFNLDIDKMIGRKCFEIVHGTEKPIPECPILKATKSHKRESSELNLNGAWMEVVVDPILDEKNNFRQAVHIVTDITAFKTVRDEIKLQSERITKFFDAINDAVFIHPFKPEGFGRFVEVNKIACSRYGYTYDEMLCLSPPDITVKANSNTHKKKDHREELFEKKQLIFEARHIKKSGETFPVEINSNIFYQHKTPYILAVVRDISERKLNEEKKEQLISELSNALDNIKTLKGLLPICSYCKKIRDDKGYWNRLESYIEKYSDALFSHGLCPECSEKKYGNEDWYIDYKKKKGEK